MLQNGTGKDFQSSQKAAYEIINRKGHTNFAIALALVRIVSGILRDENSVLIVSSFIDDYYGVNDICLNIPAVLNLNGISMHIHINLDESERDSSKACANTLKRIVKKHHI